MLVDVSKGRGQDYSTYNIIDITDGKFEQVATYRSNLISPLIFPDLIVSDAKFYNDAMVVIESNDAGVVVCNAVYYEHEYENMFVESSVKSGGIGVTMTKRVKRIGCSNLKDLIEMDKLKLHDANTIAELSTFQVRGSSYQASAGNHDDLVMNLVLFAWFVSSDAFGDLSELDLKALIYRDRAKEIEEDLPPIGELGDADSLDPIYQEMVRQTKEFNEL
jgi:hypothetical protein